MIGVRGCGMEASLYGKAVLWNIFKVVVVINGYFFRVLENWE